MAQKVHITLEDDLDGGEPTETVAFGLDGRTYEIDLNTRTPKALRDALASTSRPPAAAGGSCVRRQAPHPGRHQRPRDPRLGTLQRAQGARPRPHPVRGREAFEAGATERRRGSARSSSDRLRRVGEPSSRSVEAPSVGRLRSRRISRARVTGASSCWRRAITPRSSRAVQPSMFAVSGRRVSGAGNT